MIANNYFTEDRDLTLIFDKLVDWAPVIEACEGKEFIQHKKYQESSDDRFALAPGNQTEALDLYRSTLEGLGEFCGKEVSQKAGGLDRAGIKYENGAVQFPPEAVELYEQFRDTGLMPYAIPRESGGLGLPASITAFYSMITARADVSFTMTLNLLNLAQIVSRYGTEEQNERYAAPTAAGDTLFAMALTEPNYGSDLSNIRATAEKQADGRYLINGTKRFISQGCGLGPYPALLLTLARTGKQGGGARGLSVFLVNSSDVNIAGIERKMGIHSSPTCEVVFDNTPGELLGQERQGLTRCTLGMTNFMRLGCAAGGAGGAAAAYFESSKYAGEREQFGQTIKEIPAVAEMLDLLRRETNAMRLFSLETAFAVDMYQHEQIRMEKLGKSDREIRQNEFNRNWNTLASLFTPIAKYYCSEKGVECVSLGVQIHGGAGYTEEYDMARMYRDARINTIYEGTSQVQVSMAVGGIVSGMTETGVLRHYIEEKWQTLSNRGEPSDFLSEMRDLLEQAIPLYKNLPGGVRERFSETLVQMTARFLCGLYYEIALTKLDGEDLERWSKDCRAFGLDSCSLAHAGLYKITHASRAHNMQTDNKPAEALSGR